MEKEREEARAREDRWIAAYHEAGHAVAAYHQKRRFKRVTIIPTWEHLGCVTGIPRPNRADPADIEAFMVLLLAGAEATPRARGVYSAFHEQAQAQRWARTAHDAPLEQALCMERARAGARELVKAYRPAIEALVRALLEHRELDSARARWIIRRSLAAAEQAREGRYGSGNARSTRSLIRPVAAE
jgi:ATP-dependent Zn protease